MPLDWKIHTYSLQRRLVKQLLFSILDRVLRGEMEKYACEVG